MANSLIISTFIDNGLPTGKKGRPKKSAGKVDINELDMKVFHEIEYTVDGGTCFSGVVYSKSLKTKIKVVVWYSEDKKSHKIFFSNDISAEKIYLRVWD